METGVNDQGVSAETSEPKTSIGEKVKAAGKKIVDHFRSDSVVRAGDEAAVRIIREANPGMDEQALAQAASRFHAIAQGAGMAATAADISLTVVLSGLSGLYVKKIGIKDIPMKEGSIGADTLGVDKNKLTRNLPYGLSFGASAAGVAVFRPARALLTLLGKGIGWGGEKTARIISRITRGN